MRVAPAMPELPEQEVEEYAVPAPDGTRRWVHAPTIRHYVDQEIQLEYNMRDNYYEAVRLPAEPVFESTYDPNEGYTSWTDWWANPINDASNDLLRRNE